MLFVTKTLVYKVEYCHMVDKQPLYPSVYSLFAVIAITLFLLPPMCIHTDKTQSVLEVSQYNHTDPVCTIAICI